MKIPVQGRIVTPVAGLLQSGTPVLQANEFGLVIAFRTSSTAASPAGETRAVAHFLPPRPQPSPPAAALPAVRNT